MKNILITGDSWGVGEWGNDILDGKKVSHLGLEQYLIDDGYCVDNISMPGGSLNDIIDSLRNADLEKYDYVFVFVTDTFRNQHLTPTTYWLEKDNIKKVKSYHQTLLRDFLENINLLNKQIVLLGALTKITKKDIKGLKNLTIGIHSIIELLIPGHTQHEIYFGDILYGIPRNIDRELFEYVWEQSFRWTTVQNTSIFRPDECHPNRYGHKKIFKYLKEKFQL
jgi:hypothetical protein